jgi:AcrR family transcriptional regulator
MVRRGDSRRRVLRAAARLFSRQGFAATSVGEIASKAQASPSSIYWHFRGGKDAILLAVLEEAAESFAARIVDSVRAAGSIADKTDALFRETQQQMERSPDTLRLLMQMGLERADRDPSVRRCIRDIFRRFRAVITEELRPALPDRDLPQLEHTATLMLAMLQGIFLQWQLDPDRIDVDAVFDQLSTAVRAQLSVLGAR